MFKKILTFIGLFGILLSCTKENRELNYSNQEAKIESFVTSQLEAQKKNDPENPWIVTYNDGSVRLTMVEGKGEELKEDGTLEMFYEVYNFNNGSISNSNLVASSDTIAVILDLSVSGVLPGLKSGLTGVKKGEECMILFSGKYAYGNKAVGTIPANAALAYHVMVKSIENR